MSVHLFGIRHHGPGSARSLRAALDELQPDCVLIEGPPDAQGVLPLLTDAAMQPPVALLVYVPEQPQCAVYYPFAVFSPEWQALDYAQRRNLPTRFMDLPQSYRLAAELKRREDFAPPPGEAEPPGEEAKPPAANPQQAAAPAAQEAEAEAEAAACPLQAPRPRRLRDDPIGALAEAAGYSDSERWWEHMVEHRRDSQDLFAAILEAMTALREALSAGKDAGGETGDGVASTEAAIETDLEEERREAYMRQTIRAAESEGFQRIAVVCGAWHAPALAVMPTAKADAALLKGLEKVKVEATWVPWTYGRLTYASGYGAGITSPGWYDHIWHARDRVATRWLAKVANLLRAEDLEASPASVIEAVRLAEALAAMRGAPLAGLAELNDATQAVLGFGDDAAMQLIGKRLLISERLGGIPETTPMTPLARDLLAQQKRLKLKAEADEKTLTLDLRKPNDRERSHLLHRLNLLGVGWGVAEHLSGKRGTFNEAWRLQWRPEFAVRLIEAGVYGNTIAEAARARVIEQAAQEAALPVLTKLLEAALRADLTAAIGDIITTLQHRAAVTADVTHLMLALPPLVNVRRYGDVRKTDTEAVAEVIDGIAARICIGLPLACAGLADEAAAPLADLLGATNAALVLLDDQTRLGEWRQVLARLAEQETLNGLLAGRCCRLLFDGGALAGNEMERRMGLALSPTVEPARAAAWVEGFLQGSGLLLLHDERLWQSLDGWVTQLKGEVFTELFPLLRRTFANFPPAERRQMGERVRRVGGTPASRPLPVRDFDSQRADAVLPLLGQVLGVRE